MNELLLQEIEEFKKHRNMENLHEKKWLSSFLELVAFKDEHGHTNMPTKYERNISLGKWVITQRTLFRKGKIDPMREQLLKLAGFNFDVHKVQNWDEMFQKLTEYKKNYGHLKIPIHYSYTQLYNWLLYQRMLYWQGKLEASKLQQLIDLGVHMQKKNLNSWETNFARLVKFKKEHGHLYVCNTFTPDKHLLHFVMNLRQTRDTMLEKRRKKLDKIGFTWKPGKYVTLLLKRKRDEETWMRHFEELKSYKAKHGTCRILQRSKSQHTLARWASEQRTRRSIERLTPEKLILLREIGLFRKYKPSKRKKQKWSFMSRPRALKIINNEELKKNDPGNLERNIVDFNFSTRVIRLCNHLDIKTIGDILKYSKADFNKQRYVGVMSIMEIQDFLESLGLKLA